jgi:hypothetical protein
MGLFGNALKRWRVGWFGKGRSAGAAVVGNFGNAMVMAEPPFSSSLILS